MAEHACSQPGCDYTAKTAGAITQHTNKVHASDPVAVMRNSIPGAPRPGGGKNMQPLIAAPSGIPSIDYAIGIGGIPRGAIAEIFGPSQSGKTFTALTFSSYAQQAGERAGYVNAEKAPMETFLPLIPGLNVDALEYGEPPMAGEGATKEQKELWDGTGEATLEMSRRMIKTGGYGVWTIDSVHALTPRAALGLPIGSKAALAAVARLMSEAAPILEHEINQTNTLLIFVNHIKAIPNPGRGREWSKPGGSALDFYASIQLHVTSGTPYYRVGDNRRIGHVVRVRVHKNKVALPHAKAEYDLFYGAGKIKDDGRIAIPGIDTVSAWQSVLSEAQLIAWVGSNWVDTEGGEVIGDTPTLRDQLTDPTSPLSLRARELVYPKQYVKT